VIPFILLSPALLLNSILGGVLRGEGAARKSTIVQMSAAVFNMVLDPILIYGLGMGVMGAGLSTAISALLALTIGLSWYFRNKTVIRLDRNSFKVGKEHMKEVLDVGGPKSVENFITSFSAFLQRAFLVVAGGTTAPIFYNYTWRYIGLFNLPGKSLENAMVPVCSASYGQSDIEKMRTGYTYVFKITLTVGIIGALIVFLFAEPLLSIMAQEESMNELLPKMVWTLQTSAILIPFSAMQGIGSSMLQSMKKARISMYFQLVWCFLRLFMYALSAYGYLGIDPFDGIIYSMVVIHLLGGVILMSLGIREFKKLSKRMAEKA